MVWAVSATSRLVYPWGRAHYTGGWADPRASLDGFIEEKNLFPTHGLRAQWQILIRGSGLAEGGGDAQCGIVPYR